MTPPAPRAEDHAPEHGADPTAPQLRAAAATFDLLSAPTRLYLVWLLAAEKLDVGTLATRTGASVPAVSQHLAKLRLAGLVSEVRARRQARALITQLPCLRGFGPDRSPQAH